MKKINLFLGMAMIILMVSAPGQTITGKDINEFQVKKKSPTEVYYFHMTRRCMTCQTVEKVTEQSVKELYPDAFAKGDVTFKSVNVEEKEHKDILKKLDISGQTLLIVNGKDRFNITDKGFLYAVSSPEKLKAEIKTILDNFVK
jgi:hypothetical protein